MAIPEGYRLLTAEDIGKVFGIDLELEVYFDTEVSMDHLQYVETTNPNGQVGLLTNFFKAVNYYDGGIDDNIRALREDYLNDLNPFPDIVGNLYSNVSLWINVENEGNPILIENNLSITYYNTDYEWNTFFYVKDVSDPYNIKLTEPKLTIHCEEQTMKKDIVVQADVYDGTVEGGETVAGFIVEVATEEEMNALLETSEVNTIYKYVGETTTTYENGALYIVEESE